MKNEKGFLYVLSNPSIKGCKIGISRSHPDKRVKELSKPTGVPLPYELEYFALLPNYEFEEKRTHKYFAKFNIGKEQFDINPIDAYLYIKTLMPESEKIFPKLKKQLSEYHKEKTRIKEIKKKERLLDEDDIYYTNDSAIIHQSKGLRLRLMMKNLLGGDGVDFGKYKETKYKSKTSKFTDKELKQMSKKVRDMLGGKELKFIESQKFRDIKHLILHGNYLKKKLEIYLENEYQQYWSKKIKIVTSEKWASLEQLDKVYENCQVVYKNIVLETFRKGFFKVFDETISKHLETGSKKRLPEVPKTLENKDKDWNEFFFGFIYDTYQSEQKLKKSIIEDLIAKTN